MPSAAPRTAVVLVAEHASARFGGEAALPLHYFRVLHQRGWPVWLVCHARVREELQQLFPDAQDRIRFVEDTALHRLMWRLGARLPARLSYITTGYVARLSSQRAQKRLVAGLIRAHPEIAVVHQAMPVSPKEPSLMHGLGVPVIMGPLNGGMDYPPGFRAAGQPWVARLAALGRAGSQLLNRWMPGKLEAAIVLVANERTRAALPKGLRGEVQVLPENGVDLGLWREPDATAVAAPPGQPAHFIFMGRLVDWKAVDLLLLAFDRARLRAPMRLTVLGDGPEGPSLRALAERIGCLSDGVTPVAGSVDFAGWQTQAACAQRLRDCDALVLPSLWECGGAVVLEAMACAKPVIATAWGGPLDYLDDACGILVPPQGREALIEGLAAAMARLATDPTLRLRMGRCGRQRIEAEFDWDRKVDQVVALYARVADRAGA